MGEALTNDGYRVAISLHRATGGRLPLSDAVIGACGRIARCERVFHEFAEAECNGWVPNWFKDRYPYTEPDLCYIVAWERDFSERWERAFSRCDRWLSELSERARLGGFDGGNVVEGWSTIGDPRGGSGLVLRVRNGDVVREVYV